MDANKAVYKVQQPTIPELEKRLYDQLKKAKAYRENSLEPEWATNHFTVFSSASQLGEGGSDDRGPISIYQDMGPLIDSIPDSGVSIRYAFKYLRYLHSQAAANPPSVTFTPRTLDIQDRRAAEAATAFKEYGRKTLNVQDIQDWRTLETLVYGTGVSKLYFNPHAGEGEESEDGLSIKMKGEIEATHISVWNLFRDPDAMSVKKVKYVFEGALYDIEEAQSRWPEYAALFEKRKGLLLGKNMSSTTSTEEWLKTQVQVFEYTERGLPWNGMAGRQCFCIVEESRIRILDKMCANPHPKAGLPYQWHTDIDVPGRLEGKSFLDYISRLQDLLDRIDSHVLANIQAHGSIKIVVYDDSGVTKDDVSSDTYEVITVKGNGSAPPVYVSPPQLMPDITVYRQRILEGMEALAGMNEQMFGQVKRELSGYAVQNSINSANLTRHRFFVKYRATTEEFYSLYLLLAQEHMTGEEKIKVVGEEDAYSLKFFDKADLSGKYDFSTDYGTTFSLDPESRQEQILQLKDILKAAGVTDKQIVRSLGVSDLKGVVDIAERAKKRQMEIFDKIEALYNKGVEAGIEPQKNEEHGMMLEACTEYRSSALFQTFDRELQALLDGHIDARMEAAAKIAAPPGPPASPGPPGPPGMPAGPQAMPPMPGMPPA